MVRRRATTRPSSPSRLRPTNGSVTGSGTGSGRAGRPDREVARQGQGGRRRLGRRQRQHHRADVALVRRVRQRHDELQGVTLGEPVHRAGKGDRDGLGQVGDADRADDPVGKDDSPVRRHVVQLHESHEHPPGAGRGGRGRGGQPQRGGGDADDVDGARQGARGQRGGRPGGVGDGLGLVEGGGLGVAQRGATGPDRDGGRARHDGRLGGGQRGAGAVERRRTGEGVAGCAGEGGSRETAPTPSSGAVTSRARARAGRRFTTLRAARGTRCCVCAACNERVRRRM